MGSHSLLSAFAKIDQIVPYREVEIDSDCVCLFDFDGVLSSRVEDDIYHLDVLPTEKHLISEGARFFGIRCEGMDWRYQRHLVYQAAADRIREPIDPGPALELALQASGRLPIYIVTARSGWFAVKRLRAFLEFWNIMPTETFHVGRVEKDRQVARVHNELSEQRLIFFEDKKENLQTVLDANISGIVLAYVEDTKPRTSVDILRKKFTDVVTLAISL